MTDRQTDGVQRSALRAMRTRCKNKHTMWMQTYIQHNYVCMPVANYYAFNLKSIFDLYHARLNETIGQAGCNQFRQQSTECLWLHVKCRRRLPGCLNVVKSFGAPYSRPSDLDSGVTSGGERGRTVPGDTLQGWHSKEKKLWLNLQRIVDKRGRTGKKGVGWHLPGWVTPGDTNPSEATGPQFTPPKLKSWNPE